MRIWITAPFDDTGIKVIETLGEPEGDTFSWQEEPYGSIWTSNGWYTEGFTWHRTESAAFEAAAKYRAERIAKATADAARIAALPPVSIAA